MPTSIIWLTETLAFVPTGDGSRHTTKFPEKIESLYEYVDDEGTRAVSLNTKGVDDDYLIGPQKFSPPPV